jgi:hypothetical protein
MTIIRAPRPTESFTVIRNAIIRDSRLSYRARGVLISILSRPDNWRCSSTQLAREGLEGRDAIRTALDELEAQGYLIRLTYRNTRGQMVTDLHVRDVPNSIQPTPGKPTPGKPTTDNQAS